MRRDPSLHIRMSDLVKVLKTVGVRDYEQTARQIMERAVPYHIKNRYVISGNAKVKKKAQQMVENSSVSVQKFGGILASCRQMAGHKFAKRIENGDVDYPMLKQVAEYAHEFTERYELEPREEGYKMFIQIGLGLMGRNYAIGKFKYYRSQINEHFEAYELVKLDTAIEQTREFYKIWSAKMNQYAKTTIDLLKNKKDYANMIFGRQEAEENKANYEDWITAQFEGIGLMDDIPQLTQFYGLNSIKRYEKYMIDKNRVKGADKGRKQFKQQEDEGYDMSMLDETQQEYFRVLRARRGT